MEVWSWTDCDMGYGVGVYWYGDEETTANRRPEPEEVLNVPPLPKAMLDDLGHRGARQGVRHPRP